MQNRSQGRESGENESRLRKKAKRPPGQEMEFFSIYERDSTGIIIQHFFKILSQKLVAEYPGNTFSGNVSLTEILQSGV